MMFDMGHETGSDVLIRDPRHQIGHQGSACLRWAPWWAEDWPMTTIIMMNLEFIIRQQYIVIILRLEDIT